jgi:hypothetical protein
MEEYDMNMQTGAIEVIYRTRKMASGRLTEINPWATKVEMPRSAGHFREY